MAPVATHDNAPAELDNVQALKNSVFNPFYSPSIGDDGDQSYQYAQYKVSLYSYGVLSGYPEPLLIIATFPCGFMGAVTRDPSSRPWSFCGLEQEEFVLGCPESKAPHPRHWD